MQDQLAGEVMIVLVLTASDKTHLIISSGD